MNFKKIILVIIASAISVDLMFADTLSKSTKLQNSNIGKLSTLDNQIGEFSVQFNAQLAEKQLIKKYGSGYTGFEKDDKNTKFYCYYDPVQKSWFKILFFSYQNHSDITGIFVTNTSLCDKKYTPKKPFKPFITPKGIKLGDKKSEVLKKYGEACIVDTLKYEKECKQAESFICPKFGQKILTYGSVVQSNCSNPLGVDWNINFFLRNNKVQSILISPDG